MGRASARVALTLQRFLAAFEVLVETDFDSRERYEMCCILGRARRAYGFNVDI